MLSEESEFQADDQTSPQAEDRDDDYGVAPDLQSSQPTPLQLPASRTVRRRLFVVALVASVIVHVCGIAAVVAIVRHRHRAPFVHFANIRSVGESDPNATIAPLDQSVVFDQSESALLRPSAFAPTAAPFPLTLRSEETSELPRSRVPLAHDSSNSSPPLIGLQKDDAMLPRFAKTKLAGRVEEGPTTQASTNRRNGPSSAKVGHPPRLAGHEGTNSKSARNGYDNRGVPIPDYPSESRRRGEQGLVVFDVEILVDGRAGTITVAIDPGFSRLVDAATQAVREARFEPAESDGQPIVGHIKIPFRFVLEK